MISAIKARDLVNRNAQVIDAFLDEVDQKIVALATAGVCKHEIHFDARQQPHVASDAGPTLFVIRVSEKLRMAGYKISIQKRHYETRGSNENLSTHFIEVSW